MGDHHRIGIFLCNECLKRLQFFLLVCICYIHDSQMTVRGRTPMSRKMFERSKNAVFAEFFDEHCRATYHDVRVGAERATQFSDYGVLWIYIQVYNGSEIEIETEVREFFSKRVSRAFRFGDRFFAEGLGGGDIGKAVRGFQAIYRSTLGVHRYDERGARGIRCEFGNELFRLCGTCYISSLCSAWHIVVKENDASEVQTLNSLCNVGIFGSRSSSKSHNEHLPDYFPYCDFIEWSFFIYLFILRVCRLNSTWCFF